MPDYAKWLELGLKKDGISVEAVAASVSLNRSALYKIMRGKRKMKTEEIPLIAAAIDEPIPTGNNTVTVNVSSLVSVEWSKLKPVRGEAQLSMTHEPHARSHCAFRVAGECDQRITTVREGDDIACVGYPVPLRNNALVVVERVRGKTKECALRMVMKRGKTIYLQSIAKNAVASNAEPIHDGITIVAVARKLSRFI
jgi:hypothetical protein